MVPIHLAGEDLRTERYVELPLFELRQCTKDKNSKWHYYYFKEFSEEKNAWIYEAEDNCRGVIDKVK